MSIPATVDPGSGQIDDLRLERTLPDGVDAATMRTALERFAAVVGPEWVLSSEEEVNEYRDPFQPTEWKDYTASAVVLASTTDEVQSIARIANELGVPLWSQSQGRNNGYGGAAPRASGTVTLNLRRMNQVLEINEELGYAVVEPGVRWFDLYDAIKAGGHKLMVSVPDLGWGSVVGNSLDHGLTYLPYGEDFAAPCGMEVVLADGDLLRTGMGAMPNNPTWHLYRRGLGPTLDQLFMQSNFGIVTKMGVWLMPEPEALMSVSVNVAREEDLVPLVDTLRKLRLDETIQGVPRIMNTLCVAITMSRRSQWYTGEGPIPDKEIDRIAETMGIGRWMLITGLYGDEAIVDHRFEKLKAAFELIPGATVNGTKARPGEAAETFKAPSDLVISGVPNLELKQMGAWYGGDDGGHMGFSPVIPLTGAEVYETHLLMRRMVEEEAGLDYTNYMAVPNKRSLISVVGNTFDFTDETQTRRAYETAKLLVREMGRRGYGEYRAHLDFMDLALEQYSFNDHAYRRFVEKIKDAVDPNGILSPGKQGIWPARLRTTAP